MPLSIITNEKELIAYKRELKAALKEQALKQELNLQDETLKQEIATLRIAIWHFKYKNDNAAIKKRETIQKNFVSPIAHFVWTMLLSLGIILQETVKATTAIIGLFLFPTHFVIDGLRSFWDLYRFAFDKTMGQRKTIIGATVFNVLGLAAASAVVGLGITNPFALPLIFLGLSAAAIYKDAYVLHQTRKKIANYKLELANLSGRIEELKRSNLSLLQRTTPLTELETKHVRLQSARLARLEAKHARLEVELNNLREKRFELKRGLGFHGFSTVAVGLLIASAVLTILFPPAAAVVGMIGLLMYAGVAITNVMTSTPVISKFKKAAEWLGLKSKAAVVVSRSDGYEPLPQQAPTAKLKTVKLPVPSADEKKAPALVPVTESGFERQRARSYSYSASSSTSSDFFRKRQPEGQGLRNISPLPSAYPTSLTRSI